MKHPKESPQSESVLPVSSFAAVAGLVATGNTPRWLKEYFKEWAPSVMLGRGASQIHPTKKAMKERLRNVSNAAALLNKELGDTATGEFLERAGRVRIEYLGGLQRTLQAIAQHAEIAAASPALSTKAGKTKSGRGKAILPGSYRPRTFCAVVIAEAWKFLRGAYPAPKNREAAKAAEHFWLLSGGSTAGWGNDRIGAWRPYFQKARGPETAEMRVECLRHLKLHKQHG
jgi:hypothetical protein